MRESFEASLIASPDDVANYSVYADWLLEQSDPRGEFMQIQIALEDESKSVEERKKLAGREQELLKAHEREWLADLAPFLLDADTYQYGHNLPIQKHHQHRFRRGILETVQTGEFGRAFGKAVFEHPEIHLLQRLELLGMDWDDNDGDLVDEFFGGDPVRTCNLPSLRHFRLGGLEPGNCHEDGEGIEHVIRQMPALEDLELIAHGLNTDAIFRIPMPSLTSLRVEASHAYPLDVLARNESLVNLQRLMFWPHGLEPGDEEAYITREHLQAICRSPYFLNLRHVEIHLTSAGDDGCRELVESGLLGRLETLSLANGRISDDGARALAESGLLGNLRRLDISSNCVTPQGIAALTATGVPLVHDEMWDATGDEFDDMEYLYYGDIE